MGTIQIDGSTPKLTIGNATAEDATILFDGNAQDFYIALDDSADDLLIGLGSTVGTTPAISIDENLAVKTYGDITMTGTTPVLTIGDAGAEDTAIVFDGNAQDYHIGLDDSADTLVLGLGSTLGTTPAMTVNSSQVVTFAQNPVFPDGGVAVADLDIDGATDIGAAIVDADLFIVDDGAGGTNRKVTASRLKTYAGFDADAAQVFNDTGNDVDFRVESDNLDDAFFVDGANGRIGVGINAPAFEYDSAAASNRGIHIRAVEGSGLRALIRMEDAENSWEIISDGVFIINDSTTERFKIGEDGTLTGSGTNDISDERLKENVTNLTNSLSKVIQLRGISFTWKEQDEEGNLLRKGDAVRYGLMAQEVEPLFPDIVVNESICDHRARPEGRVNDAGESLPAVEEKHYKSINYSGLIPVLIEAIKELTTRIETLEG